MRREKRLSRASLLSCFFGKSMIIVPINVLVLTARAVVQPVQVYISQVFIIFWLMYGFIIATYYKSALMATLAVPTAPPMIDTLEELQASDLRYGMCSAKVRHS